MSDFRWYWKISFSIVQYLMLETISKVIWQFRQDHAVSKLFCFDFDFNFDFFISSPRTSFRSLKIWQYITILVDIMQYWTIYDNIRRCITIFDHILSISNNIREFRPTLAQSYCFETFLGWHNKHYVNES